MNPHLLIVMVGFFFAVVFGGLSLLRREGLSAQFAYEVLGLTVLTAIFAYLTATAVSPILFLAFIYLISMRGRLLTDIASMLSNRGRQRDALNLLRFALQLYPDRSTRMVIQVNMGIVQLRRKNPQSTVEILSSVLKESELGGLGVKYEAACRYNLGVAYKQLENKAQAIREFNEVMVIFPNSIYSQAASTALESLRKKRLEPKEEANLEEG